VCDSTACLFGVLSLTVATVNSVTPLKVQALANETEDRGHAVVPLTGMSGEKAMTLRRRSVHDAEHALKAAFSDFTRHEVARIRAQMEASMHLVRCSPWTNNLRSRMLSGFWRLFGVKVLPCIRSK
jgi:hypothetical protein